MSAGAERVFLGWDGPLLDRTADWLLERFGEDLREVLVAVPGGRAALALRERLALRAPAAWHPPRILTQGALTDEIVGLDRPVAGRLARTLAWSRALRELPSDELTALTATPPAREDARAGWRLAETVRALHADLAQEGVAFATIAADPPRAGGGEARRWRALARAQDRWRRILDEAGLADPHESRFAAIAAGHVDTSRRVVLLGVADANRLLRHALERLGDRVTALVLAPAGEAAGFDELGCLRTEAWKDRDLAFPLERWRVVAGPAEAADCTVGILAGFDGRFAREEISIGVCDEEVAPYLERRLADEGIATRHAAGTPLGRTRPARLLSDLAEWLPRRSFVAYAALLRHPDLERLLHAMRTEADAPDRDVAAALDRYHAEHLPGRVDGRWLGAEAGVLRTLHASLLDVLGDLASGAPRPLADWPAAVRAFLAAVFPDALEPEREDDRLLIESLGTLSGALGEIERLPDEVGRSPVSAADALELALSLVAGECVPPRAAEGHESAIDLLGWLELPLDPARALVVTGFQEGFVPRCDRSDPFLPDALRRKLGIPDAGDRVARDVYAATVLLRSREEVVFVSARRNRAGDPLLPSRLAFHAPASVVLERVDHLLRVDDESPDAPVAQVAPRDRYAPPRLASAPRVESMRVTDFKAYLQSPYGFYLERVLGLEPADDSRREMDPGSFGGLAHAVLEGFGTSDLRDSTDAAGIERWLRARVEDLGRRRFGECALPAVEMQLAQLSRRMSLFARAQAARAAEGWRILEVEWQPRLAVELDLEPGEEPMPLRGKIDRIEVHEARGEWAILDYKTGRAKDPESEHRSRGEWRDLQLPLYTLLARELRLKGEPRLGYFGVGGDEADIRVRLVEWGSADLESAIEVARDVVRRIRRGEVFELGRGLRDDPILSALAGKGLVEAATADDDESEDAEDGE